MMIYSLLLAASAPAAIDVPAGLQFGFWRIAAMQARAKELRCETGDLDGKFAAVRKRLVKQYGKEAFKLPDIPKSGPGDCYPVVMVYRVNLEEYETQAEAALAEAE